MQTPIILSDFLAFLTLSVNLSTSISSLLQPLTVLMEDKTSSAIVIESATYPNLITECLINVGIIIAVKRNVAGREQSAIKAKVQE